MITGALTPVNPAGGGHHWSSNDMENEGGPETSKCVTLALSGRSIGGSRGHCYVSQTYMSRIRRPIMFWGGGAGSINVTDKGQGFQFIPPSSLPSSVLGFSEEKILQRD